MPTFEVYRLLDRHWRLLGNIPAKDPRKAAIKAARMFNKMKLGVRASGSSGKLLEFHFRYLPF